MLLGVTSPVLAPRIGATRDVEERMQKWSEGIEPCLIRWNVAAMHSFDLSFPDAWSRKVSKSHHPRSPRNPNIWNKVYSPANDQSRVRKPGREKVVVIELGKESGGGIYMTVDELAPHGDESVELLVNDELFYYAIDSSMDMHQGPS